MGLSTEQMFRHIVEMQIELNEKTVPGWLSEGLDWDTAILVEVAEAIDSTNWKWWKHTDTDLANLKIEAIDLLHFLVAQIADQSWHAWRQARKPDKAFIDAACDHVVKAYSWAMVDSERTKDAGYVLHLKGVARYTLNAVPVQALHELFMLFSALGMGVDDIYKAYITKNLLNHYRQERGYKDPNGGYLKIINEREDNVVFAAVIDDILRLNARAPLTLKQVREHAFDLMDRAIIRSD